MSERGFTLLVCMHNNVPRFDKTQGHHSARDALSCLSVQWSNIRSTVKVKGLDTKKLFEHIFGLIFY